MYGKCLLYLTNDNPVKFTRKRITAVRKKKTKTCESL